MSDYLYIGLQIIGFIPPRFRSILTDGIYSISSSVSRFAADARKRFDKRLSYSLHPPPSPFHPSPPPPPPLFPRPFPFPVGRLVLHFIYLSNSSPRHGIVPNHRETRAAPIVIFNRKILLI